ncbi:Lactoylglutathione lyase [Wickerhamomyces ciferrii]|uniref:Lactoylglutathione lyase n=1 Tax=Wickerhamomyces ciferrii (strain ATCC 14091 / BCRC 22168 / CBS 111 / JCM 3599 / NBRC 0793 / NRRL Y-1031 F-60-10) TaxID=1206466 RepID=K0KTF8_WICCF|nr:Lactoylglutathione lyase [Wickerhamomyces ciferrii]CCH46451.1 Lactoylglutathione lyase [Wickerhamomyces ciferrii]
MFRQSISKQLNNSIKSNTFIRTMASYNPKSLLLNHTCLRVKDPKISVDYYTKNYGLKLIRHEKMPEMKFDLYFLAQDDSKGSQFAKEGVLELTHNYGTENDPNYKINNGNEEPYRGFGHICFSVDNIEAASEKLLNNGVAFKKKLTDGRQKNIAFALDPDGYWVELIEHGSDKVQGVSNTNSYKFNHTMIRVKDPVKSLKFYREVLGMKLLSTSEHESAKFTLYFLGYEHDDSFKENSLSREEQSKRESVLELTHNWGTENDSDFKYHNGNEQPQGYGHIGIALDNPGEFCNGIDSKFGDELTWGLKFNQGKMKNIAFIKDPDNYAIEILPKNYTV